MVFSFKNYSNLLIIGGGDFQLATEIGLEAPLGSSITIVDPVIHSYTPFVKYYVEAEINEELYWRRAGRNGFV